MHFGVFFSRDKIHINNLNSLAKILLSCRYRQERRFSVSNVEGFLADKPADRDSYLASFSQEETTFVA